MKGGILLNTSTVCTNFNNFIGFCYLAKGNSLEEVHLQQNRVEALELVN